MPLSRPVITGFSASFTVTICAALLVMPEASVTVQVTVVVPTGKVLPLTALGGLTVIEGGGLHPPLAVTV